MCNLLTRVSYLLSGGCQVGKKIVKMKGRIFGIIDGVKLVVVPPTLSSKVSRTPQRKLISRDITKGSVVIVIYFAIVAVSGCSQIVMDPRCRWIECFVTNQFDTGA